MNAVEEETSRANENARDGCVRSEDVMRESDKEDERTWPKWLKCVAAMATGNAQIRQGYAKMHRA